MVTGLAGRCRRPDRMGGPDAMPGRGGADQEGVPDADSPAVPASQVPESPWPRAGHYVHPVDGSIYLDNWQGSVRLSPLSGTARAGSRAELVTYSGWTAASLPCALPYRKSHGQPSAWIRASIGILQHRQ
jgi:hypothetical protein